MAHVHSREREVRFRVGANGPQGTAGASRDARRQGVLAGGNALMGSPHILLAEGDPAIRAAVGEVLTVLGYRVTTVADGTAVLAAARTEPPDLLILDLDLPVVDGRSVLELLQHDPRSRTIPLVVVTGDPQDLPPFPGVAAIVGKPMRADLLAGAVRAFFAPSTVA